MTRPKDPNAKPKVQREFIVSEDLQNVAEEVIQKEHIDTKGISIAYLLVFPNISKTVAGKCIKSSKEMKFLGKVDYVIEISGELWDVLEEDVRYILVHHELMHILSINNEKTGERELKIRQHDVQDFSKLIDRHGVYWIDMVKTSVSSLNDLTPDEQDKIRI